MIHLLTLLALTLVPLPLSEAPAYAVGASGLPAGFEDTLIASVSGPTEIRWTPDGRTLVTEKTGRFRVINAAGTLLSTPALDLTAQLCSNGERGLVGLAVHPNFAANHWIYLYYTYPKFGNCNESEINGPVNRISRFVLPDSNVIDPSTETVLLESPPMFKDHHTGGDLHFGRDGYLYATVGDSGAQSLGWPRDPGRLAGKLVRITDTGGIPADNPFTGAGTARCNVGGVPPAGSPSSMTCQEILTVGLRNPFRMAMDPNAGGVRFFVNDVGQHTWEEISEGPVFGGDYGWPEREGPCAKDSDTDCGPPPAGMTNPIHWYHHGPNGAAVTGGAFIPNGLWPSTYDNGYLYADYVFGKIYLMKSGGPPCPSCGPPTSGMTVTEFATATQVVSMRFGPYGSSQALYFVTRDGSEVHRIAFVGGANRSPTAVATATPTSGPAALDVSFDGSSSSDPDGDTLTYEWDFETDGVVDATGAMVTHRYEIDGTYSATLTVSDGRGGQSTDTLRIDVGNLPPVVTIDAPADDTLFSVGERFTLHGHATDPETGPLPDSALTWEVLRHHATHTHPSLEPTSGNDLEIVAPEPEDLDAANDSYLEIRLSATDLQGLTQTVSRNLNPRNVALTFQSSPSGLVINVAGTNVTTPSTVNSWNMWNLPVNAPDQSDAAGNSWVFDSWSDGGTQAHTILTPSSPATYTAAFRSAGGGTTVSLTPVADSYVSSAEPNRNFGAKTTFRTDASPTLRSYLRFDLTGVGSPITQAVLRVFPNSGNAIGYEVRGVSDTTWGERTITFNNAPPVSTTITGTSGRVTQGQWTEVDITSMVTGNVPLSLAMTSTSTTATTFASRESGANAPQLIVTVGSGGGGDTAPPSDPSNLVATPIGPNRIDLTWSPSIDPGGSIASYEIFRDGNLLTMVGAVTTFSDTTVAPNTSYAYKVRAIDAAGNPSGFSNTSSATTPSAGGGGKLVFVPTDDAYVRPDSPTSNFGSASSIQVDGSPIKELLLRFEVQGTGLQTVQSAVLRLYVVDGSDNGGTFRASTSTSWSQSTVTWNTAPGTLASPVASLASVRSGTWVELDVTAFVTGDGPLSLRANSASTNGADYSSSEGTAGFAPQLIVTLM